MESLKALRQQFLLWFGLVVVFAICLGFLMGSQSAIANDRLEAVPVNEVAIADENGQELQNCTVQTTSRLTRYRYCPSGWIMTGVTHITRSSGTSFPPRVECARLQVLCPMNN